MAYPNAKVAGALFFVASSQFAIGLIVAESLFPGYSVSTNYVSDLGVGRSAAIFNSSVFLMGLLILFATYFLQRSSDFNVLTVFLVLTGVGAMGVGVFTEDFGIIHGVVSLIAFLFGGLSAITSFKLLRLPFSILAVILGVMSLSALSLFAAGIDLSLGPGGMERMILYPILAWGAGFGGHLIGQTENQTVQQKS
jgi:hypothetical membrane protein